MFGRTIPSLADFEGNCPRTLLQLHTVASLLGRGRPATKLSRPDGVRARSSASKAYRCSHSNLEAWLPAAERLDATPDLSIADDQQATLHLQDVGPAQFQRRSIRAPVLGVV